MSTISNGFLLRYPFRTKSKEMISVKLEIVKKWRSSIEIQLHKLEPNDKKGRSEMQVLELTRDDLLLILKGFEIELSSESEALKHAATLNFEQKLQFIEKVIGAKP